MSTSTLHCFLVLTLFSSCILNILTIVESIGVCHGTVANNLPPSREVVDLYKRYGITRMRLYNPNQEALEALRYSNIELMIGVTNEDVQRIATSVDAALDWISVNIEPFVPFVSFKYIVVGNEIIPGELAPSVLPAMMNMNDAIFAVRLQNHIKVSTAIDLNVLSVSYPPSASAFTPQAENFLAPIVTFLNSNNAPLLVNVYPYLSYVSDQKNIELSYALFTHDGVVVQDGRLGYQNLFGAATDSVYSALEKIRGSNVRIVVSETGWPSSGGVAATIENAQIHNQNLIKHQAQGTPKRPGMMEVHMFAMFNENLKIPPGIENNFGLFYPNKDPVYPIIFN